MNFLKNKLGWVQALLVFVVAVLQYSNTLEHDYAWDDAIVLTQNSRVQKGLSDIPELFENIKSERTENRYGYRPIALLSFATDVELFGMDPKAAHRTNVILYAILCAFIFYFLRGLFPESAEWAVFGVTLLFVVHPLHTEVVANIKSRDEILALIFGLGGLHFLRQGLVSGRWWLYLLMVLAMALSFTSKESGITFCGVALVMPVYSSLIDRKNLKPVFIGTLATLGGLAALLLLRNYVYSERFFQTNDWDLIYKGIFVQDGFSGNPLWDASIGEKLATALYLLYYGVYRFFAPMPLLHDYSYNMFAVRSWSDGDVYLAMVVVAALTALMVHGLVKRKPHGLGLVFYFVTNSIYLHLVHVGPDIFAERYLFVPSLGICMALLSLFPGSMVRSKYLVWVLPLVALPLFKYSWQRNAAWKDNNTLLKADLALLSNCSRTNYNYAIYLHNRYYGLPPEQQPKAAAEILQYYEQSLAITDRIFKVYMDLGAACMEFGRPERALEVFTEAAEKYPKLSGAFVQLGKFYMAYGKFDMAIPYFDKAIENGSANSDYYYFKGVCQMKIGQAENALKTLEEGERLVATSVNYYVLLATIYLNNGDKEKMKAAIEKGKKMFPNQTELSAMEAKVQTMNKN
ncbi:MAG: hypothetical protein H6601_04240 [Flavobacteriales bacterium]|nr:hypothetical protein [Flavobacteriales bacterium]